MPSIFSTWNFEFPYHYKFPGQASDERILGILREHPLMLALRLFGVFALALIAVILSITINSLVGSAAGNVLALLGTLFAAVITVVGSYWYISIWKKSIAIVTTKRLTKFIYTTPFNRHNLSLPLEMIVDTGSYSKGFFQAMFNMGTFTARSSASSSGAATDDPDRVNKKYFYIEHVFAAEDLQHYVSKVLQGMRTKSEQMQSFRPFLPYLKGERRKQFMKAHPEFWS